jgi:hypothetical protein
VKRYMTAVIELPDDPVQRKAVIDALPLFEDFHGGRVTAVYAGDAIRETELFEKVTGAAIGASVRREAAGLVASQSGFESPGSGASGPILNGVLP